MATDYVDRVKLAFGTTLLYDEDFLGEQIRLLRAAEIEVSPGGTCGEIALHPGRFPQFLARAHDLGFTTIEVSDGTIPGGHTFRMVVYQQEAVAHWPEQPVPR